MCGIGNMHISHIFLFTDFFETVRIRKMNEINRMEI